MKRIEVALMVMAAGIALGAAAGNPMPPALAPPQTVQERMDQRRAQQMGFGGGNFEPAPRVETRPGDPTTLAEANTVQKDLQSQLEGLTDDPLATVSSRQAIAARMTELNGERERMRLTLAGKRAKEEALQKKIQQLTDEGEREVATDRTLELLKKIAAMKQSAADSKTRMMTQGIVPQAEQDAAIAEAAEAAVRVEERREAIMAGVGGGSLPALNKELLSTSLDINEQMAMLRFVEDRISQLHQALEQVLPQLLHVGALINQMANDQQAREMPRPVPATQK